VALPDVESRAAVEPPEPEPGNDAVAGRGRRGFGGLWGKSLGDLLWYGFLAVVLSASVALRFIAVSPLWLDEAQSTAIARLPLTGADPTMFGALRQDGSPPLYYLLLHWWIGVFGDGQTAVRALSGALSLIGIPFLYLLARRVAGERVGRVVVVFYAASPFALRYATEARMYALVVLLTALLGLGIERTLRRPAAGPALGVALCSGLLALTHYWCFFLLITLVLWLAWLGVRGREVPRRNARIALGSVLAGGIVFLPWLSSFLYQRQHTGTPWGVPASYAAIVHAYSEWAGGPTTAGRLAFVLVAALLAFAVFGTSAGRMRVLLDFRAHQPGLTLVALATATLLVAVGVGRLVGNAYADRYTATAYVPFVIALGCGTLCLVDRWLFRGVVAALVVISLAIGVRNAGMDRTQAGEVATVLSRQARPGDIVLTCPDQLGPAVARLAPAGVRLYGVPTLTDPARVDWVDYARRNADADGYVVGQQALQLAGSHTLWFVAGYDYRTYETLCPHVNYVLSNQRPHNQQLVQADSSVFEHEALVAYYPR
jgi:hypothetical protein